MSLYPQFGVPLSLAGIEVVSPDLFEMDFANAVWSPGGDLYAASGHYGTPTRGATLASVADATGTATYTAVNQQPAWEQRDWDNDGVREAFGLRMGTSDRLGFATDLRPMAMAGLLEMIETGARTSASSCLWSLREDAATGNGIWLDTSGTYYRLNYKSGATTRTATLSSGQPASGDRVTFTWQLASDGALTFYQSINGAAATSASAAALALPAAWASGAKFRFNSNGTGNAGQGWYRRCRVVAGALNATTILERR